MRNPDETLRRLERAAALGDTAAQARLARAVARTEHPTLALVRDLITRANKGARADISRINERQVGTVARLIMGIPELGIFPQICAWSWLSRRKRVVLMVRCGEHIIVGMTPCLPGSGSRSHTDSNWWSPWLTGEYGDYGTYPEDEQGPAGPAGPASSVPLGTYYNRSFPHRYEGIRVRELDDKSALAGRAPRLRYRDTVRRPGEPSEDYYRRAREEYDMRRAAQGGALMMPEGAWRYYRTFYVADPEDGRFSTRIAAWCSQGPQPDRLLLDEGAVSLIASAWS